MHPFLRTARRFFVGQVVNLQPIGNRPAASSSQKSHAEGARYQKREQK
jgi:hypothetical protein